ncbi:hypothetical protein F5B20DRAFT_103714 [Whalleya microplaca]|nr:hypothetical protein F5B20DRAFT_103714 [Whalleya microplaca]
MAPNTPPSLAISCAENIAVLQLLHSVPISPSPNPETETQRQLTGYTLSFDEERSLAGTLAFLAHTKDDPNYIPAVCLQEDPGASYLNVLISVNKSGPNDGKQILQVLREKFDGIFSLLTQVDDGSQDIRDDVFKAIVSMCSMRILQRLRFTSSYKNKGKPPVKDALRKAIDYFRHAELRQFDDPGLFTAAFAFVYKGKKVVALIDAYTKHQTQPRLEELIDGIYHLRWQVRPLRALLDKISPTTMEQSARDHLYNMINKVARYREAARLLCYTARNIPLVRRMRTILAELPEEAFNRVPLPDSYNLSLDAKLSKTQGLKKGEMNLDRICNLLQTNKKDANKQFGTQTKQTLKESKIHAEIQLLYFIEMRPLSSSSSSRTPLRVPRVVCSSKDACWLCNCFILMYGRIHTPKCHGRLYPGWRLPALGGPIFADLANRYNQRLQNQARDSIRLLLRRAERTAYPDPNESTLLTLRWSNSTLASAIPPEVLLGTEEPEVREVVAVDAQSAPTHAQDTQEPTVTENKETKESLPSIRDWAQGPSGANAKQTEDVPTKPEPSSSPTGDNASPNQGESEPETVDISKAVEIDAQPTIIPDKVDAPDKIQAAGEGPNANKEASDSKVVNQVDPGPAPAPQPARSRSRSISWSRPQSQSQSQSRPYSPIPPPKPLPLRAPPMPTRAPPIPSPSHSTLKSSYSRALAPGVPKSRQVPQGADTPLYTAGPLEVQIEYASAEPGQGQGSGKSKGATLSCAVEWLTEREAARLRSNGGKLPLVDVTAFEGEIATGTDEAGCIYLCAQEAVMRICLRPGV